MDTTVDTGPTQDVVEIGPRDDEPFTIDEIREHIADLRDAHPGDPAVTDVLNIVDALLAHHDCRQQARVETGRLAPVVPLPPARG